MTRPEALRLLTQEPASLNEKIRLLIQFAAIVAEDQKCGECGNLGGFDYDKMNIVVDTGQLTVEFYCSHCGAYTLINFKNIFKKVDALTITGHRNTLPLKKMRAAEKAYKQAI